MAAKETLASFRTQIRGVMFYSLSECGIARGVLVNFVRRPDSCRDTNCVEARVAGVGTKLGHVAAEAAEWLSPLLLGPFHISG